jgi:hypothetical protein
VNPVDAFEIGIAPEHIPALVAVIALPAIVLLVAHLRVPMPVGLGERRTTPRPPLNLFDQWAAWLLGICAAVHLALPLGQHDRPVLTIGFLAVGAAYAWLAMRVVDGRSWRLWSGLLFTASLGAYAVVSASGAEQPDQVGIVTVMVELTGLGLCLVPLRRGDGRKRHLVRFFGGAGTVFATFLVGVLIWAGALAAHTGTSTDVSAAGASASTSALDHDHHSHVQDSRAQAGFVVGPVDGTDATPQQEAAAAKLVSDLKTDLAKYADLDVALKAGYKLPAAAEGMEVHLENAAYKKDGRVLDPTRPETLVYAISGGRAALLGALFVMEKAGTPGPAIGGPITHWHAHNVCVTAIPPGFGLVNPFGGCTALSVNITTPEMMHVWVVDSPAGPFADGLDDTWVKAYLAQHGVPYTLH